jgi:hypothetical protein
MAGSCPSHCVPAGGRIPLHCPQDRVELVVLHFLHALDPLARETLDEKDPAARSQSRDCFVREVRVKETHYHPPHYL